MGNICLPTEQQVKDDYNYDLGVYGFKKNVIISFNVLGQSDKFKRFSLL